MKIVKLPVSSMFVNCYLYYDEDTKEAAIIDPGAEPDKLNSYIDDNHLNLKYILLTHGHFDHIGAVDGVRDHTGAPVLAHRLEGAFLKDPDLNESNRILRKTLSISADRLLEDGEMITVGNGQLKVIHTPGHSPGGVSYYDEKDGQLFSGDTLFFESVGRSDFSYGDHQTLVNSVKEKLFLLPDTTSVLPGHGQSTSIGHEKQCNPFIR